MLKVESKETGLEHESTTLNNVGEIFAQYEEQFTNSINERNYLASETALLGLCIRLTDLRKEEQLFIVRTFFMHILAKHVSMKKKLYKEPSTLHANCIHLAHKIDLAKEMSDFIELIPEFTKELMFN